MLVYVFVALTLLVAGIALWLAFRADRRAPAQIALAAALAFFVYVYGAWVYGSVYLKDVFLVVAALIIIRSLLRQPVRRPGKNRAAGHVLMALVLLVLSVLYFTGTSGRVEYADMRFPLKNGRYFVLQGGKGLPANIFHFSSRRAAYAMDLVKLDRWGRRCNKVFSDDLHDYFIFGDTVFAPCGGIIRRAIADNPDNIPPDRVRGPHNLNGVVIESRDYTVFLGHLQHLKIFVQRGDSVRPGQALGLAGNSGMSLEPHLHIQAHKKAADGEPWYSQPQLFLRFDGKTYLLFEEVAIR